MNCQDAREHFSELLDAHIGLTERVPLEAHLRECEACQQELEALRVSERPRPPVWRPNLTLDFLGQALERIRSSDAMDRLRQRLFPRNRVIRRGRPPSALFGRTLNMMRSAARVSLRRRSVHARPKMAWRPRLPVDLVPKAVEAIRRIDIVKRLRRSASSLRRLGPPLQRVLALVGRALETARSLAAATWHRRSLVLHVRIRHLRLAATVALVVLTVGAFLRYRAELDVAVRRWVPSAPSSVEDPPPPRMASTEPATRPEIPPVSPPATPVPAPPALYPSPAPSAPDKPSEVKAPAPRQEPVMLKRAQAPSSPEREAHADRPAKPATSKPTQVEQQVQKGKNGGARPNVGAPAAPRKDKASETVSAAPPTASGDRRPSLDVVGKLRVKSRSGAERDLAALVAKAGGTTVSRQRGDKITVIEAVVPNPSYGKFAEGLTRIGSWQIEAGRSRLPDPVRVTVRLAE
jgi:hypothetical protein